MPANDMTQAEMSLATERLLDEALPHLEATPYLTHLIEPIQAILRAFVDDQVDPQAEVRAAATVVQGLTAAFDDRIRGIEHLLLGFGLLEEDPETKALIEHARGEVLPDGRQIINRTAGDKAAEAQLMDGRLRGDVEGVLDNLWIGGQTIMGYIRRTLLPGAEALGDAQAERLAIEDRTGHRTRGFNLATRRRFLQVESALRSLLDIHEADDALRDAVLGHVDRLIARAERRATQRRNAAGGLPPTPDLDLINAPPGGPEGAPDDTDGPGDAPAVEPDPAPAGLDEAPRSEGVAPRPLSTDRGGSSSDPSARG